MPATFEYPELPKKEWTATEHGASRSDEYHWIADKENPLVIEWLEANNLHAHKALAGSDRLQEKIFDELFRLTPPDEGQAAWKAGRYWYRTRYDKDRNYPVFIRTSGSPDGNEKILIDGDQLSRGHDYFAIEGIQLSADGNMLAFAVDTVGNRLFNLRFKDLAKDVFLPYQIEGVEPLSAWAADSRTIFYARPDTETLRPCEVYMHRIGDDPGNDKLVFEEKDKTFRCFVMLTRSRKYIFIHSYSMDADEIRFIPSDDPGRTPEIICPRRARHEYEADHYGRTFVIRTNLGAPDFRICECPAENPTPPEKWRELLPPRENVFIENVAVFKRHLVLIEYESGLQRARIVSLETGASHKIVFPDDVHHVWIDSNPDIESSKLRLGYTSLVTPVSFYDYDMDTQVLELVRREEVPGYESENYITKRILAPTSDGVSVPVTLVYRADALEKGPAPTLAFGYGAYGTNMPLYFDQSRLVLLDRGFVYAMVHVRGSSVLGHAWREGGRLLQKKNTINDFIAAIEHLSSSGVARRGELFAESLSAGGLLLGAVINMRPKLFLGIIAREPFVDMLNSISDPDLPLTDFEYKEWGDPKISGEWEYMKSYSPYDNIVRQEYPNVLATAGLNDGQVPFWEPAKWVARLRDNNTAATKILLLTNMRAGHGGMSGRKDRLRELAFIYSFILDCLFI